MCFIRIGLIVKQFGIVAWVIRGVTLVLKFGVMDSVVVDGLEVSHFDFFGKVFFIEIEVRVL
jgi:hypothetical protein